MQEDKTIAFPDIFVDHPRYGKQFLVESYEQPIQLLPMD